MTKKIFISSEQLKDFNEIFRKDMTYGNFKTDQKPGCCSLIRRHRNGKPQVGGVKLTIFKNEDKFFENIFMEKLYSHKTEWSNSQKKALLVESNYNFRNSLIWANILILKSITKSFILMDKEDKSFSNISIFCEVMVPDHSICDNDLRKEMKKIV